jgi:hypothetical protein
LPARDEEEELRRDKDLVAVIKELEEEFESRVENIESWRGRAKIQQEMLRGLKVVSVRVGIEILDYDGKEQVRVFGGAE